MITNNQWISADMKQCHVAICVSLNEEDIKKGHVFN